MAYCDTVTIPLRFKQSQSVYSNLHKCAWVSMIFVKSPKSSTLFCMFLPLLKSVFFYLLDIFSRVKQAIVSYFQIFTGYMHFALLLYHSRPKTASDSPQLLSENPFGKQKSTVLSDGAKLFFSNSIFTNAKASNSRRPTPAHPTALFLQLDLIHLQKRRQRSGHMPERTPEECVQITHALFLHICQHASALYNGSAQ